MAFWDGRMKSAALCLCKLVIVYIQTWYTLVWLVSCGIFSVAFHRRVLTSAAA